MQLLELGFGRNSLQSPPSFVQPGGPEADFALQTRAGGYAADSACINAGTPPGTDIGAVPAHTPVPEGLAAEKTDEGVRVHWNLPYLADTIIAGFYVYRREASEEAFNEVVRIADPGAREFLDPAGRSGLEYCVSSYRPGGAVQGEPSAAVGVK